jgi:hypothetical protein
MNRRVNLVPRQRFRYLYICSSMMSVHPEGWGSNRRLSPDVPRGTVNLIGGELDCNIQVIRNIDTRF